MTTLVSSPHLNAYRDSIRPYGVLEEFACQRLAVARWYYERATALAARYEDESPESTRYQNMARRWESSYNAAMRELRKLQTERALANPNCHPAARRCRKDSTPCETNVRSHRAVTQRVQVPLQEFSVCLDS